MSKFKTSGLCAAILAGAFGLVAAAPAFAADTGSRVIVKFKAGAFAKGRAEVAAQGGRVLVDLAELDAISTKLSPKAIALLKRSKNVEFVEVDHPMYPMAVLPTEVVPYGIPMVQADQVSDSDAGNRKVCIIDSGIDGAHPDLQGLPMTGENFTTSGQWNTDESAHGTHVAGTIAGVGGNGLGVVGVMPNKKIKLHIAKVFDATGSTASSTVAKAMLGCRKAGANVVSMSLGGAGSSKLQAIAAKLLDKRGVLMIASAGNAGDNTISYPAGLPEVMSVAAVDQTGARGSFSQFNADVEITAPGVAVLSTVPAGSVIGGSATVGATAYTVLPMDGSPLASATGALADFGLGDTPVAGSMTGKVCLISRGVISFADKVVNCTTSGGVAAIIYNNTAGELAGTMGEIVTSIPSVGATQADGATMLGQVGQSTTVGVIGLPDQYDYYNGTSMSAPHVSAVAALVWSKSPTCTASQIRESLKKSALDLGAPGRDDEHGAGLVQAKAAVDRIATLGCGN
jgi:subtilisin family serine protease